ncbi:hypothetical protein IT400_03100 [Candidatus Nomurabacteria bacterium]|nr:hypothetical protein [Candidatus Nomurabacteria bacterium]
MKESFQAQNNEPKKEVITGAQKERSDLAKHAKRILFATSVAVSALFPNKSEAQKVKEKAPKIYTDKNEYKKAKQAYDDSLELYNISNSEKEKDLPEYGISYKDVPFNSDQKIKYQKEILGEDWIGGRNKDINPRIKKGIGDIPSLLYHKKIAPWGYQEQNYKGKKDGFYHGTKIIPTTPIYKKPVQPVKYKPDVKKVEEKDTVSPVVEIKKVEEEKTPETKSVLGTFTIKGKEINYYSEKEKNEILDKLKIHNIPVYRVGDSQNFTVSRFYDGSIEEF